MSFEKWLLEILFGVEAELDEAFEEFVGGYTKEVAQDEFLGIEPANVAQLERFVARGVNEVAMTAVDDDDVFVGIKARAPEFAGGALESIGRDAFAGVLAFFGDGQKRLGDGEQRFGVATDVVLGDGEADAGQAGFGRSAKDDDLRGFVFQTTFAFDDLPFEDEIVFDKALGAIAGDGAKVFGGINSDDG